MCNSPNNVLLEILMDFTQNHVSLVRVLSTVNFRRALSRHLSAVTSSGEGGLGETDDDHVSLDAVHLRLELGPLGVHARYDVADVADDRREDEDGGRRPRGC